MDIAIVTLDCFNELDSLIAAGILGRMSPHGWNVRICSPAPIVQSRSGTRVERQEDLSYANHADAVLIGSGWRTRDWVADDAIMGQLKLDPTRQLIGSQCSGALVLHRLGLLADGVACTDGMTRPMLEQLGVRVQPAAFRAAGNVATAGGCLSSQYLAAWVLLRLAGEAKTREILSCVAPVGEEEDFVRRALSIVSAAPEAVAP
ncbi:AraC family transcriptional regulator [Chromobacterium violaceum]|uniref:AraC family transcriptional regulator n=1 Tax=Chromobacterium violaceum TaxID=536 RepID=A0AAX2M9N6_CHRVL|nr:AraC family transcriptional regulator [Chromobacterium violaceum]OLZ78528.1 AraC family transcriptional regulator [Chromobacterium violaceum]OQS49612.1 AraC family transcriptional regulator [Chromobacterium violaceum]OQS51907.1 AraC family transcriptional regulator [Chromobacterium violaceum]QRO34249.1 AraC family transcriptional regulator [Chromobacterium violaceum]QRQ15948.1 AraC family transcriptional regulator [Chromobacterium violaceum]